ncbi:hypothetical protein SLNSH_20590 [Alsobacter soli]|uniref:Glycoside hydrolase family 5 domain-containing protein n=1 Tax=Alsobacter soli TaxID=2109933 RepID=A0A2T1HN94_9HYPH|nr:glycoside hydrolase family 5 protein [Alsobacter soli]PSC03130.1 hypothetical protein SLNSH_20590 [Alsobacter soli]
MNLGININGSDWNLYPTQDEIDYFAAKGFHSIRVPFEWSLVQSSEFGDLNPYPVDKLEEIVRYAAHAGINVILDLHSYGYGPGDHSYDHGPGGLIGAETSVPAFADLWGKLASVFANDGNVVFGLMNEPQVSSSSTWLAAVNAAIAAIREAGASQPVLVPGLNWDSAATWTVTDNASVLGAPGAIVDPAHNFAFEVHQYLDADMSGQSASVVSSTIGVERLEAVTHWAETTGAKLFLGEFGVANDTTSLQALDGMLGFMQAHPSVWLGGTYWAAGESWHDYMYSVEPALGIIDAAQMDVLEAHTGATLTRAVLDNGDVQYTTYVPGRMQPTIIDILDAGGALKSRALFDIDGHLSKTLDVAVDGFYSLTGYAASGHADSSKVYDSGQHLLSSTTVADSGIRETQLFHSGDYSPYQIDTYGADGVLANRLVTESDGGHIDYLYSDGKISCVQKFDAGWQLTSQAEYCANGALSRFTTTDDHGNHAVQQFDSIGSMVVNLTVYTPDWLNVVSSTTYEANGMARCVSFERIDPSSEWRASTIDTIQADGAIFERATLNPNGTVASLDHVNPDQTHTVSVLSADGTTLQSWETYDADWHLESRVSFTPAGQVSSVQHDTSSGGHYVASYTAGAGQPASIDAYDAAWQWQSRTSFDFAGHVATDSLTQDGGHAVISYGADGDVLSQELYSSAWQLQSRVSYENGHVASIQIDTSAGAHVVATFDQAGAAASNIQLFDAEWAMLDSFHFDTLANAYRADGPEGIGGPITLAPELGAAVTGLAATPFPAAAHDYHGELDFLAQTLHTAQDALAHWH